MKNGKPVQQLLAAGLFLLLLLISAAVGLFVFDRVRQFIAASDMLPAFTIEEQGSGESGEVSYEIGQPLPRWEGTDRVNILLLGIDERENEQGPWRTDTMLILTIDPVILTGGMLSIPRDLWVPIPGFDDGRINTAHYLGDAYDYPGGGPALAVKTVQYNLGVPIHHYARVNFSAFEQLVDLIGGIDIYVEEEIDDPTYPDEGYGYDPLHIPVGRQHFDGEMALKYARTRHTLGGDFDRAKRQQQVLIAIFKKVTELDMLPRLAAQAPEIWRTLQGSVATDLTLDQIIALAQLASEVNPDNIRYGVIDENYTQFWETPDGQQVLIPLRDRIRELRDYIFSNEPVAGAPAAQQTVGADPVARLAEEGATIEVLNGTTREGLAARTAGLLETEGLTVAFTGNADSSEYTDSLIIEYTGKTYTAEYIARFLGLPLTAVVHGANPNAEYDIAIILGADYTPSAVGTPSPTP